MEELLNAFGTTALWPMILVALPLVSGGWWLRRLGRRRTLALARARASRRSIRELTAGEVMVSGRFTALGGGRALLEEGEDRAVIEREPNAPAIVDGERVLVAGLAIDQVDDPRPGGYRARARLWRIDARGSSALVAPGANGFERATRAARLRGTLGALLFAAGVAVAVASSVIAWRAAVQVDDTGSYGEVE
jgi:hypothetical protein